MDKTVVMITPGFAAGETDTSSVAYLQDYVSALISKMGAEKIKIVALHYPFTRKKYTWKGVEVFPLNGRNKKGISRLLLFSRAVTLIKKITRDRHCILHSFWLTDAAVIGSYLARKYHVPHITTAMGQDTKPENRFLRLFDMNTLRVAALSDNHANVFRETTGREVDHVVPFGVPPADPIHLNTQRQLDLLFVGSFIPVKQPEAFVEIARLLKNDFPFTTAAMAGDGPMLNEIKTLANNEGLQNHIRFCGLLSREKIFEIMGNAKLLIHTSSFEAQSHVFAEALAHGMYVLSFDVGHIEKTPQHVVCSSINDMAIQAYKLLSAETVYTPWQTFTHYDTAETYLAIYETMNGVV